MLDSNTSTTLYNQLADSIKADILSGIYKTDQQIPTEFELKEKYNVSRSTVRKAIDALVSENLLIKIHGKGTFVAPPQVKHKSSSFYSTTQSMAFLGKTVKSTVLAREVIETDSSVASFFELPLENAKVVSVYRLRFLDDSPLCLETLYFPIKLITILEEDFSKSLYDILANKFSLFPCDGEKNIRICYARSDEASMLGVSPDSALMLIKDYVKDQNGDPLYVSKQVHAGEMVRYGITPVQFFDK